MTLPLVAIIGRPNVGKSSLFNRFLRKRLAIVDDEPGITRDRNYAVCDWRGREFYLIDTGGIIPDSKKGIEKLVLEQSEIAIEQADLVVLAVDAQVPPDNVDEKIARRLLKSGKKVILLANKADNETLENERFRYERLGLGEPLPVSATGGRGIGEALDSIVRQLPLAPLAEEKEEAIRIAVVGRPNVGKSSFINKLIGQDRVIVSPAPGTTRDSIDTPFEFGGRRYILIDTAGLRRKARVSEDLEFYTTLRTLRAIENSHIVLVLVDGYEGLSVQDVKIVEDAAEARRGIVLAVNKWDIVEKDEKTVDQFTVRIKEYSRELSYIPIVYISALTGQRVTKVLPVIDKVYENWNRQVATSDLNTLLEAAVKKQPPAAARGKYIKINYATQTETRPPSFLFFCNFPSLLQKSYLRFLENQLRQEYDFEGIPIRIKVRRK